MSLSLPNDLYTITPIWEKVKRFAFIRSGFRIVIRVNGTKFHYGKLLCAFRPLETSPGLGKSTLQCLSGYPHVIVTPTANEVHELVIPYCHPFQAVPISTEGFTVPQGVFHIVVLNPLSNGVAVSPVEVTAFVNFENPELAGYTYHNSAAPALSTDASSLTFSGSPFSATSVLILEAQSGEALTKAKLGVVSGVLETVGDIVNYFSTLNLSVLSSFIKYSATIARNMGYCKPLNLETISRRVLRTSNIALTHGIDNGESISLLPDNSIKPCYELIASHDREMSLAHYASRPGLMSIINWTGSQEPGTELAGYFVHPTNVSSDLVAGTLVYNIPISFAAFAATYWRGSVKFCIQVTCSAFHSGRLRIGWNPFFDSSDDVIEASSLVSHVLDLQTETEFHMTVPYLKRTLWAPVRRTYFADASNTSNGVLSISVLNTLTHAEFPVPPVFINVWMMAGPDFQLAVPSLPDCAAIDTSLEAQSGSSMSMRDAEYLPLVPATGMLDKGICMGDYINSISDWINRPCPEAIITTSTSLVTFQLNPYSTPFQTSGAVGISGTDLSSTWVDYWRLTFAVCRGSINYKSLTYGGVENTTFTLSRYVNFGASRLTVVASSLTGLVRQIPAGAHVSLDSTLQFPETHIPYYSNMISIPNAASPGTFTAGHLTGLYISKTPASGAVGGTTNAYLLVSAGDDFRLGFQVGPPTFFRTNNNV